MTCEEAIQILHKALPGLKEKYGIVDLSLFGSVARNEAGPESDVDVLVTFGSGADLLDLVNLGFALEELLGRKVDLATPDALRSRARPSIARDLVHVA